MGGCVFHFCKRVRGLIEGKNKKCLAKKRKSASENDKNARGLDL